MTLPELCRLIRDLNAAGVVLRIEGGRMAYACPKGAMTPPLLARLKAAKEGLLRWVVDGALAETAPMTPARARMEAELARRPWLNAETLGALRGWFEWHADEGEERALGRVLGNLREIEQSRAVRLREGRAA